MDKITHYFRSVLNLTFLVFGWFKRLIFWRKSHSFKNEDNLLPITVNTSNKSAQFNYSSSSIVNSYNSNINSNWNLINNRHPVKQQENEIQEEPNYFEDMNLTPSLTKQKKVYIQNNNQPQYKEPNYSNYQSDRLSFDGQNMYAQNNNELGILEETNDDVCWENDLDVNADIDENMKIMRQEERERRIAEHKRIMMEKELKKAKSHKSNFMATKIS